MSEEAEYEVDLGSFEDDASKQVAANVAMFVSGWEEADRSPAAPNAPVNDPDSPPGGMDALAADVEKEFDTISPGVRGEEGAGDEGDEVAGSAVSGRSAPSGESTWPILNALKLIQKVYQV